MSDENNAEAEDGFEGGDSSVMIDLTNVEDIVDEIIPKGKYPGVIEDCTFKYSQNSGKPMWELKLRITEGEFENRILYNYISFSDKAIALSKKTLAQIAPEFLEGPFNPEERQGDMEGKAVTIVTKIQKYEGQNRTSVARLEKAGDADAFMAG